MMIGLVQPGTSRGTLRQMIGSRKIVPPRMLRIVPLGDGYIALRLNSLTLASSAVIVALLDAQIVIEERYVEIGMDQLVLDELPDDSRHLVAIELDHGVLHFDLGH